MSTTVKSGRAWVPALVTTLLAVMVLFGCGLLWEILQDRDVAALQDPDSALGVFVYGPLAPLGGPGIVGPADFGDHMLYLGSGLVPVVVLVFLFTWLSARAARAGSSFTVLLGAWLGTMLGTGLGALASYEAFLRDNELPDGSFGLQVQRLSRVEAGLYWGAVGGLLLGIVAMLTWLIVRPRAVEEPPADEFTEPWPPDPSGTSDVSAFPPPGKHQEPASTPPPTTVQDTVRAPEPTQEP